MPHDNNCPNYGELSIRIDNLEEDVKELKQDQKENSKFYAETLSFLRENLTRLTVIMERYDEKLENLDKKFDVLETDIKEKNNENDKWYKNIISIVLKFLIYLVVGLIGAKALGIDVTKIFGG